MATLEPEQTFITSDESLDALCDQLINTSVIAIDTEFMGEEHFIPRLELIQVAAEKKAAAEAKAKADAEAARLAKIEAERIAKAKAEAAAP